MSSRSRIRSERGRLRVAAVLLALIAVQFSAPAARAAPVPLPVAATLPSGSQTALVVDLGAGAPADRKSVAVTRDGASLPATLVPVVSDGLAVALVVDTSAAGAATLPAWLSAAARFILEAPATTQAVVIRDAAPAATITGPQRGPTGVVRALTSVSAGGVRDTAAALKLAAAQFPGTAAGRRVVVLYTTGADAGGESATALAARLRSSGTILVVVGTADGDPYWATAAAGTGGFFAPAGNPVVIPALDQVETTLRGRYLVQFPTPSRLPARVSVRVDTGDLTLTAEAVVAAPAASKPARTNWPIWVAAALVLLAVVVFLWLRRRRPPADESVVARGRAAVPGTVARGRATVPENPPE